MSYKPLEIEQVVENEEFDPNEGKGCVIGLGIIIVVLLGLALKGLL